MIDRIRLFSTGIVIGSVISACVPILCRCYDNAYLPASSIEASADADAPGMLGGRWNLWEYIGDTAARLIGIY